MKRVSYGQTAVVAVIYYVDWGLDINVLHGFTRPDASGKTHPGWFAMSLTFMCLGVLVSFLFDIAPYLDARRLAKPSHPGARSKQQRTAEELDRVDDSGVPLFPWTALWQNLTLTKMLFEARRAFKYLGAGYQPPPGFDATKIAEGLFEAVPQSLLQTYVKGHTQRSHILWWIR